MDVPTTSGRNSYTAAYEALTSALAEYPDVMYIVDIHRDILLDEDGNMQRPVTYGTDGAMAQMRLVVGTDADGAAYEDWESGAAARFRRQDSINICRPPSLRWKSEPAETAWRRRSEPRGLSARCSRPQFKNEKTASFRNGKTLLCSRYIF